jgi:hypothetical protein
MNSFISGALIDFIKYFNIKNKGRLAERLRSLTSNHLPLTAVGSNPDKDFGFFHMRKLSS